MLNLTFNVAWILFKETGIMCAYLMSHDRFSSNANVVLCVPLGRLRAGGIVWDVGIWCEW